MCGDEEILNSLQDLRPHSNTGVTQARLLLNKEKIPELKSSGYTVMVK